MDPVEALREIAFWLERGQAERYRVRAFRTAADVVAAMAPDEVTAKALDGRLRRVKGIGERTFAVVREAADGGLPGYLLQLREGAQESGPADAGSELLAQLRGDLHSHSEASDGTVPLEQMAAAGRWLGREYLALTDHSPSLTIANGLDAERLGRQLEAVAAVNESAESAGFRLLTGIEVDILEDGTLDQTPEMLATLDVVVASVHSKLRSDSGPMTRRMLAAVEDPHTDVLGHCTGRLVQGARGTRPESQFDAARVFAACADAGVAVEINSRPERQDPPDRLIQTALEAGCLFSIDSDAHAPGQLDFLRYGAARAAANGVPAERIVTTWPLARLLRWTARRRASRR